MSSAALRRLRCAASCAALLCLAGCPPKTVTKGPVDPNPATLTSEGEPVQGAYVWYGRSRASGLLRAELEVWQLAEGDGGVLGTLRRRVWVIAEDGAPFRCNQGHWFASTAEYQVAGKRDGRDIELRETAVAVEPSPCDPGHRQLATYRGIHIGGALHVTSDHGKQIVRRHRNPPPLPSPVREPPVVTGNYDWVTEVRTDDVTRIEREQWQLVEQDGIVDGSYVRTVEETMQSGVFRCNGKSVRRWTDRYTVSGARDGRKLRLRELEARPAPPARCLPYRERSLDGAFGTVYSDSVVLVWRNSRRQVLRRSGPAPPVQSGNSREHREFLGQIPDPVYTQ